MDAFLRALQGGQLPAGTRRELDTRFGAQVTDDLIAAGLLVPGPRAAHYPCPRLGSACPRDVIENVGDPAFPLVAAPPGPEHCCDAVRLTAEDVATWTTSRQRLVALVAELFRVRGPANLRDEVFPCAHRLGRAAWLGQERDVLLCTNLNGAAPTAFLLARKAQLHLARRRRPLRLGRGRGRVPRRRARARGRPGAAPPGAHRPRARRDLRRPGVLRARRPRRRVRDRRGHLPPAALERRGRARPPARPHDHRLRRPAPDRPPRGRRVPRGQRDPAAGRRLRSASRPCAPRRSAPSTG